MKHPQETKVVIDYLKNYPQYLDAITKWIFDEWGESFGASTLAATRERVAGRMQDDRVPLTMIALIDGEPVGTASLKVDDMDTRPELTPWVAGVYVKEGLRSRGIGNALVTGAEEAAVKIGIKNLYLFTPDRRSFYERMGWRLFEQTEYRGEQITILSKKIA